MEESVQTIVQANTLFALDLYQELRKAEGNLFFSPYSISTALAMAYAGARHDTERQMREVLHFPDNQQYVHEAMSSLQVHLNAIKSRGEVLLDIGNSLWPQAGYALLEQFISLVERYYSVSITPVDYRKREAACRTINTWIEGVTQNKVRDMLQPDMIDALTRLVIVNAIYFKGDWVWQFDPEQTHDVPFWVTPAQSLPVAMMRVKRWFRYTETDDMQVLQLLYRGGFVSMTILLPRRVEGLKELEVGLTADNLARWTSELSLFDVEVYLPKFKLTEVIRLSEGLSMLGMQDAFTFHHADFSGIESTRELFIGEVLHKAYIDVNEEGTEAAAATAAEARGAKIQPPPALVRIDHPFIFLIDEWDTGSILFLGRVMDPSAQAG